MKLLYDVRRRPGGRLEWPSLVVYLPGIWLCVLVALAAAFVAEQHGGPMLLYALLMGLALNGLAGIDKVYAGLDLCARAGLRCGVALLGVRITWDQVATLGAGHGVGVALSVLATIGCGLLLARWMRRSREEGLVAGCAVAICGASAALAVAAVLPPTQDNERFTLLAVVGVTVLSTVAMVAYPGLLHVLELPPQAAGVVLGGTIHDVAQVVAAGLMMGQEVGDTAAVVKLFRVALLVPIVAVIAWVYRHRSGSVEGRRGPAVPGFLIGFLVLVALASTGTLGPSAVAVATEGSRWLLAVAIAAAGAKTNFVDLAKLGWQPALMLVAETLFIALLVLAWVY